MSGADELSPRTSVRSGQPVEPHDDDEAPSPLVDSTTERFPPGTRASTPVDDDPARRDEGDRPASAIDSAVGSPAGEGAGGMAGRPAGDRAEADDHVMDTLFDAPPADDPGLDDPERLRAVVEAVLLVVDTPTEAQLLGQVLGRPVTEIERALEELRLEYDAGRRGLDLRPVAGGWRLYSREEFAPYVERFVLEGQHARLTKAALESLAVIAYRQPVTRSRVSAIRGVNVDAVMRTLLGRGLVEECGVDADTGGGLYRTTALFLEKLGLGSLDELPSLAPLLPDSSQLDDVALST